MIGEGQDIIKNAYKLICSPFYREDFESDIYVTLGVMAYSVPFLIFFASFWQRELYTLFFSVASFGNWLVNFLIREATLKDNVPLGGCTGYSHGMPSLETQQAFFLVGFVNFYALYWGRPLGGLFRKISFIITVYIYAAFVSIGQVHLGSNTPLQTITGGVLGMLVAHVFQSIFFIAVYPYFPVILNWVVIKWLGYRDSLCLISFDDQSNMAFFRDAVLPVYMSEPGHSSKDATSFTRSVEERQRRMLDSGLLD